MIEFREARHADVAAMVGVQNAIYRAGLRAFPVDARSVIERYFDADHSVALTVADRDGVVVGFQSLVRAWEGNPYDVAVEWGIIGTHIHPDVSRMGIGRGLFQRSLAAARAIGLCHIDATIAVENGPALAYYAAMGFSPYRDRAAAISHRYDL